MPTYVNDSNVWKIPSKTYANVYGVWREIATTYVNDNGVWKPIGENASQPTDFSYGYPYFWGKSYTYEYHTPYRYRTQTIFTKFIAQYQFGVLLDKNNRIYTFGKNNFGQLGDGTWNDSGTNLVSVAGSYKNFSCGYYSTIALKHDGTLWGWGANYNHELAMWSTNVNTPTQIGTDNDWAYIDMFSTSAVALKTNGAMYRWGSHYNSDGTSNPGTTPQRIGPLDAWKSVSTGHGFVAAVRSDGTLWLEGRIDNRSTPEIPYYSSLTQIGTDTNWVHVSCGEHHLIATKSTGTIWGLGRNEYGQLFNKGSNQWVSTLTRLDNNTDWKSAQCSTWHSLLNKTNGTIWSVGRNNIGQLGDGTTVDKSSPVQVGSSLNFLTFWGNSHTASAAIDAVHTGNDDIDKIYLPDAPTSGGGGGGGGGGGSEPPPNPTILESSGIVYAWGIDPEHFGSSGVSSVPVAIGSTKDNFVKVVYCLRYDGGYQVFRTTYIALDNYGRIYMIGDNTTNLLPDHSEDIIHEWTQVESDSDWKDIFQFAHDSFCAIKTDGTLWGWGQNYYQRFGIGVQTLRHVTKIGGNDTWKSVHTGGANTLGIKTDGTIWALGQNYGGRTCWSISVHRAGELKYSIFADWDGL